MSIEIGSGVEFEMATIEQLYPNIPLTGASNVPGIVPELDTAEFKFGNSSLYFNMPYPPPAGEGMIVQTPLSNISIASYPQMTHEIWFKQSQIFTNFTIKKLFGLGNTSSITANKAFFTIDVSNTFTAPYTRIINVRMEISGNQIVLTSSGSTGVADTDWHHFAWVKNGISNSFYFDGNLLDMAVPINISDANWNSLLFSGSQYGIGSVNANPGPYQDYETFGGWFDELRISNIVRYTSNFTPPTQAFVPDRNTIALYHFDGSDGSTNFPDDPAFGFVPNGMTIT
jgi:hypothetical protein